MLVQSHCWALWIAVVSVGVCECWWLAGSFSQQGSCDLKRGCQWVCGNLLYICWLTGDMVLHDAAKTRCHNMLCSHTHCKTGCLNVL